ncbi:MAG: hypothetical protein SNG14_03900, partial [Rikenellaceae bacterium]
TPYIQDGYWYINGVSTEVAATGTTGDDGYTPYIQDGYWYINGVSTEVAATGATGDDGYTPYIKDGYWYINGVSTEVKAAGTDVTVAGITYRNMDDYALFFFDAIEGVVSERIIYAPMYIQTPTSITLMTSTIDLTVGGSADFDVIVNPTANGKDIEKFYLVAESGYSTRATSESTYGAAPTGLTCTSAQHKDGNGRYTITVKCADDAATTDPFFVAAKYKVDALTDDAKTALSSTNGEVSAENYTNYLASTDGTAYNEEKEYELISSTPIQDVEFTYNPLEDSDFADFAAVNLVMYEGDTDSFSILTSDANLINVAGVDATSVQVNNVDATDLTQSNVSYQDGKVSVTAATLAAPAAMTEYDITVKITDKTAPTANEFTKTFKVTVYPKPATAIAISTLIEDWLPSSLSGSIVGSSINLSQSTYIDSDFKYEFGGDVTLSFTDTYDLKTLVGLDAEYGTDASFVATPVISEDLKSAVFSLNGQNSDGEALQPGTYTITYNGTATPSSPLSTLEAVAVTLTHTIKVNAPVYTIEAASTASSSISTNIYTTATWGTIDVSDIVDATSITETAGCLNQYRFAKDGDDNQITNNGVRSIVNGVNTNEVAFPELSAASEDIATLSFYYQLDETNVKIPVSFTDNTYTYDSFYVKYYMISLSTVSLSYNSGNNLSYSSDPSATFTATKSCEAVQNQVTIKSSNDVQVNGNGYIASVEYTYEIDTAYGLKYYDNNNNVTAIPATDPSITSVIEVNKTSGKVSYSADNLIWKADDIVYSQQVIVTATDCFGKSKQATVEVKIKK